jgi:hypothetical protein
MTPARQRLDKHGLKAGIVAEAEVNVLGNGTHTDKGIPVATNRVTEPNLLLDTVTYIRVA